MTVYSYCTATQIEQEIRATDVFSTSTTPSLATINEWIQQESAQINKDSARVWGTTDVSEIIDYDGHEVIQVRHTPIVSVSSVLYSTSALGTDSYALSSTKTADTDYTVDKERGEIIILPSWSPAEGRKRIQINYISGYETIPLTVQKLATKKVALRTLNSLLQSNVDQGNDGGSISVGSISIVEPGSYGVQTFTKLESDINQLEMDLTKNFGMHRYGNYYRG